MDRGVSQPELQPIVFRGPLSGFIGLAVVNFLLTVVTLGIYRFWARARVRRYLWENATFAGEPLEYNGKGLELLIGAILGFIIILVPYAGVQVLAGVLIGAKHPILAGLFVIAIIVGLYYLVGVGLYRSERYMLSRTSWRGIRGGMTTGGWGYGWLYFRLQLLRVVTLGLTTPYISTRLWNARMNDAMFGSARVEATAQWKPLYLRFILALVGGAVIYGIAFAFLFTIIRAGVGEHIDPKTPPDFKVMLPLIARAYGILLAAAILMGLAALSYHAAYFRQVIGNTRIETLGLKFDASAANWFGYYFGNFLIIVLTLGLGLAIMPWRAWSFYMRHLRTVGTLDTDALLQTQLAAPTQGDGIADAIGFSLMPF
jgi:uncharacterized membrane protein YjgN (DUF898 family)